MLFAASTTAPEYAQLSVQPWHWVALLVWFSALIFIDLFVFQKSDHEIPLKNAARQTGAWISLGVLLGIVFFVGFGQQAGVEYFSGYLIEMSLSIDNVFAWSVLMAYYGIPKMYQHRVLYWGIFGAIAMRALFIFAGIEIIQRFEGVLIIFGLVLLFSGYKLLASRKDHTFNPGESRLLRFTQRVIPVSHELEGHKFFVRKNGKRMATVLFMALLTIEVTDAIFAIDSVPAILAVARDPFIVLASNAAAILGLRSLFFVFEKIKQQFWLLHHALGILLVSVGIKMLISPDKVFGFKWFGIHLPTLVSLGSIVVIIGSGVVLSLVLKQPHSTQKTTD